MDSFEEVERRLEYMHGQLIGAQVAIRALIRVHPNPAAAQQHVEHMVERFVAAGLNSSGTSEALLLGLQSSVKALLPAEDDTNPPRAR